MATIAVCGVDRAAARPGRATPGSSSTTCSGFRDLGHEVLFLDRLEPAMLGAERAGGDGGDLARGALAGRDDGRRRPRATATALLLDGGGETIGALARRGCWTRLQPRRSADQRQRLPRRRGAAGGGAATGLPRHRSRLRADVGGAGPGRDVRRPRRLRHGRARTSAARAARCRRRPRVDHRRRRRSCSSAGRRRRGGAPSPASAAGAARSGRSSTRASPTGCARTSSGASSSCRRGAMRRFEIALDIDAEDRGDRGALRAGRWRLRRPGEDRASDLEPTGRYLQGSMAEIAIAKDLYVGTRGGWFSDRSACYLASGKPVLAQDTGFGECAAHGGGACSASSDLDEAAQAAEEVRAEPARSTAPAARRSPRSIFDSRKVVLASLLEQAGGRMRTAARAGHIGAGDRPAPELGLRRASSPRAGSTRTSSRSRASIW